MYSHDVFITVRQKSRQSTLCIVVKGIEKFISNIYEARHQLLDITTPRIQADIPATYLAPNEKAKNSNSVSALLAGRATQAPFSPLSPINPMPFLQWPTQIPQNDFQQFQNLRHQMQQLSMTPNVLAASTSKMQTSTLYHQQQQQQQQQQLQMHHKNFPFNNNTNNTNIRNGNHNYQLRQPQQQQQQQGHLQLPAHLLSPKNTSDIHSSGYQSLNCSSNSLDQQQQSSASSIIHISPDTTTTTNGGNNNINQSGNRNMSYGDSPPYSMNENNNDTRSPLQHQQQNQQQQQLNDMPKVEQ
jgi:protein bicaudal C